MVAGFFLVCTLQFFYVFYVSHCDVENFAIKRHEIMFLTKSGIR